MAFHNNGASSKKMKEGINIEILDLTCRWNYAVPVPKPKVQLGLVLTTKNYMHLHPNLTLHNYLLLMTSWMMLVSNSFIKTRIDKWFLSSMFGWPCRYLAGGRATST